MKMFTVFDSKVESYLPPVFYRSRGEAIRMFQGAISAPDTMFSKHPADFTLFELGSWDESTAKFVLYPTPTSVGTALELCSKSSE